MPLLINDLDASVQWGFRISGAPGWMDAPPKTTIAAQVIRRGGQRVVNTPLDQPRRLTLNGHITGTSVQDARDKADALRLALSANPVKLSFPDYSTRYVYARLDSFSVPAKGPDFIQRKLLCDVALTAHDPYSYDNNASTLADAAHLPLGTGPVRPVDTITGAAVNPVLTLRDTAGNVIGTIGLTIACVGGDVIIIDHDAKTITKNGANVLSALTSGDFFAMDPADPKYQGAGPTITAVVGGAGVHTTTYRKAWR